MKSRRIQLALAVTMSSALALSACAGGGGGNGGDNPGGGGTQGTGEQSGIAQNNPQDRNSLEQGGTLTLPLASFPTNYNGWHIDGNLADWS